MSEQKKYLDLDGLSHFWEKAKEYQELSLIDKYTVKNFSLDLWDPFLEPEQYPTLLDSLTDKNYTGTISAITGLGSYDRENDYTTYPHFVYEYRSWIFHLESNKMIAQIVNPIGDGAPQVPMGSFRRLGWLQGETYIWDDWKRFDIIIDTDLNGDSMNPISNKAVAAETSSIRALISNHKTTNDAKFTQLENLDGILNVGVVNTIEEFKDGFFDNHNSNGDIATGKIFTFTLTEEFSQSLGCSKGSYIGFVVDGIHTADKDVDGSWNCKAINIRTNYLYDLYVPGRNYGAGGDFNFTRKQYFPKDLTLDWFNGYTGLDDILNNIGYRLSFSQEEITKDNVMWYTGDGTSNAPQYLNGNRSLTNSTCTITGCVTLLDGWEHIYYSLPKAAIETTVAYGVSSSGQRIKFITDTHENTSVLHFTPAAGGGFSAGELDFTFTYKIKGDI